MRVPVPNRPFPSPPLTLPPSISIPPINSRTPVRHLPCLRSRLGLPSHLGNPRIEVAPFGLKPGAQTDPGMGAVSPSRSYSDGMGAVSPSRSYSDALQWVISVAKSDSDLAVPPTYIVEFPDLVKRGWGWDRLVAYNNYEVEWPHYKKYLVDYYIKNAGRIRTVCAKQKPETVGEGVAAAKLCRKLEKKLLSQREDYLTHEDILLSKDIKKHAKDLIESKDESSLAAAVMVCIAKEAELILKLPTGFSDWNTDKMVTFSNQIRRSALKLMPFRGSKYADAVAGAMLGLAAEVELVQGYLSTENPCVSLKYEISLKIRECTSVLLTQFEDKFAQETAEVEEKSKLEKSKLEKRKKPVKQTTLKKIKLNGETETKLHTGATVARTEGLKAEGQLSREFSKNFTVFVGNLPWSVDSAQLKGLFKQAGSVKMAQVIYNTSIGRSRGFGFVTMSSLKEFEAAVEKFHGYLLDGRMIRVSAAQKPPMLQ